VSAVHRATAVAIAGRAVLIEGPPGSGKSSLALALIDRGAVLIGDDAVTLEVVDGRLLASPPPHIAGLIEVRNLGLLTMPVFGGVPVALVLVLDHEAPRYVETADKVVRVGAPSPLPFRGGAGGGASPPGSALGDSPHPNLPEGEGLEPLIAVTLPMLRLWPDSPVLALRAELALERYGVTVESDKESGR
jgi:hypothetical protein